MYYLSLGGIFRMENSWLEEWIQYHLAIGVEHIILYNDDLDTHVSDRILRPYVERGLVENIPVRGTNGRIRDDAQWRQYDAYREMIRNAVGRTRWLGLLDLDEFLFPREKDDLREMMSEYEEHDALAMNWTIYGSGGHLTRPPTQIRHFLNRSEIYWDRNAFVKSIIKPERVLRDEPHHTHVFPTRNGTVNENHDPVRWISHEISTEKIRINHYVVRSWQDFWEVKVPRPRMGGNSACGAEYFEFHDRNEVFDDEIARRFGHVIEKR